MREDLFQRCLICGDCGAMSCSRLLALDAGVVGWEKEMSIRSSANPLKYDDERSGVVVELVFSLLIPSITIVIEEFDCWRYIGGGLSGMYELVCDPVLMPVALVLGADVAFSVIANLS